MLAARLAPAAPRRRAAPLTAAAAASRPRRGAALRVEALAAGAADHTVRVRGDPGRVSFYCADLAAWPAWSPVTRSAVKLGAAGEPVARGSKFELEQSLWGVLTYKMM
jgi:hypothetical protein